MLSPWGGWGVPPTPKYNDLDKLESKQSVDAFILLRKCYTYADGFFKKRYHFLRFFYVHIDM